MTGTDKSTYIIVHDLEHTPVDTKFTDWPLHITLAFYFSFENNREAEIIDGISEAIQEFGQVSVSPGRVAMFGPKKDVTVTEIYDDNGELTKLHLLLIEKISNLNCDFIDLAYSLDNFRPHVSNQGLRKCPREPFILRDISIIKKISETNAWEKKVVKRISL